MNFHSTKSGKIKLSDLKEQNDDITYLIFRIHSLIPLYSNTNDLAFPI
ncbi:hypothetical protein BN1423_1100001 [Carnobacterium maltaromaticum]|nr:conserved hypothetical protein [Carnobacterium maltaromaticum]CRH20308.1 hypothetical protein CM318V1_680023 [Carnobacterium maltaromaticum]CRH20725.1 hypothetical protein BN1423_1100001 [Carnobacterium maltaromaticum]